MLFPLYPIMWKHFRHIRIKAGHFLNKAAATQNQTTKTQLIRTNHYIRCAHTTTVAATQVKLLNTPTAYCANQSNKYYSDCQPNASIFVQKKYKEMEQNLKWRADPVIKTLNTPQFQSILRKNVIDLVAVFKKNKYEIRIAGGAVRDLLMDITPADIDFATTATPQQMIDMFEKEKIRTINMKGERHGTITPRINDEENFEVTTLRIDVKTDGRHATVEFTTDWLLDANRRDLTINSMFLGFDGKVYDYFFGYEDLLNRRVKFVGDASNRIKEDYLRIMRYFRFYGRICETAHNHDPETIDAICLNIDGLQRISGERIYTELKKIIQGKYGIDLLAKLIECGAARYIGFPANSECHELHRLKHVLDTSFLNIPINPMTIFAALINSHDEALSMHSRLKLSAYERDLLYFLAAYKHGAIGNNDLLSYQKACLPQKNRSFNLLKEFVLELLKYHGKRDLYDQLYEWEQPKYPLNGQSLMDRGVNGKRVGGILNRLRDIWADSNFQMSGEELLQHHLDVVKQQIMDEEEILRKRKKLK